jgi:hypothetical protein
LLPTTFNSVWLALRAEALENKELSMVWYSR